VAQGRSLSLRDLEGRLKRQGASGAYAFCGPEGFLKQEALQALLRALLGDERAATGARYALATFRLGEHEADEILSAAMQTGLFGAERVVWVDGLERAGRLRPKEREAWIRALGRETANPLILCSPETAFELRKRTKIHAEILARTTVVDFARLEAPAAAAWLTRQAERFGVRLSAPAARRIVGHLGPDLMTLAQEVEKLSLLHGPGDLGVEDLRAMARSGLIGGSWECVEAALQGKHVEALQRLQSVRREESAFSFNWKLSYAAANRLAEPGGAPARGFGAWTAGGRGGGRSPLPPRAKNLLGRMLDECYEWERRMKSGRWPGAHDYTALEAVLVAHAARARGDRAGMESDEGARHGASD